MAFIELTEIVCNGHEIMGRTQRVFNSAWFVSLTPIEFASGHTPKCTAIVLGRQTTIYVAETAGWIAQKLGCKRED